MALRRLALCPTFSSKKFIEFSQFRACRYISSESKNQLISSDTDVSNRDNNNTYNTDRLTPLELCEELFRMCRRAKGKTADQVAKMSIKQNEFDSLYKRVDKVSMLLSTGKLINLLQSLHQLNNYIQDTTTLRELEGQALSRLESFTFCQTATLLKIYKIYNNLDATQAKLYESAKIHLIQMLEKQSSFDNLLSALQMVTDNILPKTILDQLEDKLYKELSKYLSKTKNYGQEKKEEIQGVEHDSNHEHNNMVTLKMSEKPYEESNADQRITYNNLSKLFVLLAHNGRRPTTLLRIISDLYVDIPSSENVDPNHLVETLTALSRMQYPDHKVLERILKDLVTANFSECLSVNNITTLLITLSKLQWSQEAVMNQCLERIKRDNNGLRPKDLIAFICTCATLNYKPEELESVYNTKIVDNVKSISLKSPPTRLRYVWSLGMLGLATEADMLSVLNEEFYNSLKADQQRRSNTEDISSDDRLKLLFLQSNAHHSMGLKNIRLKSLETGVHQ